MEITIEKKYLVFPVNTNAKNKQVSFRENGKTVYELNLKLDLTAPDFYAYLDMNRYRGKKLEMSVEPQMEVSFRQEETMEIPDLYREPLRPQIHFSPKNGWLNDPNGLIYLDGSYHMFFQYNPAGNNWDNMHWGHAVSKDLIHWEEKDIALFIEGDVNAFSGSAVWDQKNLLSPDEGAKAALLFYTATTHPFTQRLAYSTDGFQTIREYEGNPILPHLEGGNRDPKVVYCGERGEYIMALYFIWNDYGLFSSKDLVHWELFQRITFPEESECPDLFPICDKEGVRKWVFMGANDHYLVGEFREGKFVPVQEAERLHYGSAAYAGQTFSNLSEGRVVRICWDRWYSKATKFNGQMGIPMELTLEIEEGRHYLCAEPVKELKSLSVKETVLEELTIHAGEEKKIPLQDSAYLLEISGTYAEDTVLEMRIFGCSFRVDFPENQLVTGDLQAPLSAKRNSFLLTLIADQCSMEFFTDQGRAYLSAVTEETICDRNLPWLGIKADREYTIDQIKLFELKSIW